MKAFKRIGAIVLTGAMVLGMSMTAFAIDDQTGTLAKNGVVKNADHSSVGITLDIPKGITVYGSLDKVYGPTVNYTYSIAPAAVPSGAKVTDYNDIEHIVEAGPEGTISLTDPNASFTSYEVVLSDGSAEITDNITVNIDTAAFSKPGIYRYVITDTTSTEALYNAGITRADDYIKTRYLDVYVKYDSTETAFEVYGYVLTDTNIIAIEGTDDKPLSWETPTKKSSGYIASSETTKGTDEYHTIDVNVTKAVTGAMGDKTKEFEFAIAVSNSSLHFYSGEVASALTQVSQLTDGTTTNLSASLKHGDVFYIYGLNPKATVNYTEKNNTPDTYQVTIKDNANAIVNTVENASTTPMVGTQTTDELAVSNYNTDNSTSSVKAAITASDSKAITFTNNLNEISPTGVVLRIAPYALMLAAGLSLLLISRRRRMAEEV